MKFINKIYKLIPRKKKFLKSFVVFIVIFLIIFLPVYFLVINKNNNNIILPAPLLGIKYVPNLNELENVSDVINLNNYCFPDIENMDNDGSLYIPNTIIYDIANIFNIKNNCVKGQYEIIQIIGDSDIQPCNDINQIIKLGESPDGYGSMLINLIINKSDEYKLGSVVKKLSNSYPDKNILTIIIPIKNEEIDNSMYILFIIDSDKVKKYKKINNVVLQEGSPLYEYVMAGNYNVIDKILKNCNSAT